MNFIKSPNYWDGKLKNIKAIVIHKTLGSFDGSIQWFKNPKSYSSAHLIISKNGEVVEMVKPRDAAWHAGRVSIPSWPGIKKNWRGKYINPNLYTYGIELEAGLKDEWTEKQRDELIKQIKRLAKKFDLPISRDTIISHNEITAGKPDISHWSNYIVNHILQEKNIIQETIASLEKAIDYLKLVK